MATNQEELGLEDFIAESSARRRKLIPLWIKVFIWIFMIMGTLVPLVVLLSVLGGQPALALYGLETNDSFSGVGLLLCALFLLKGTVAYGLWSERGWAIKAGIGDAIIGIVVCIVVMLMPVRNQQASFSFRLELVALIPYLFWLLKTKAAWENKPRLTNAFLNGS